MREYRTMLIGPKRDVAGKLTFPVSDWEMVEIYDDAGNFLMRGLQQHIPAVYADAGFDSDKNSNRPLAPVTGDRKFIDSMNEPYLLGIEQISDIDSPAQDGEGPISGYSKI